MATTGIRTLNLPQVVTVDELLGHQEMGDGAKRNVRIPLQALASAIGADGGRVVARTLEDLEALLDYPANTHAEVVDDPGGPSVNGTYRKFGAPLAGGWTRVSALGLDVLGERVDAVEAAVDGKQPVDPQLTSLADMSTNETDRIKAFGARTTSPGVPEQLADGSWTTRSIGGSSVANLATIGRVEDAVGAEATARAAAIDAEETARNAGDAALAAAATAEQLRRVPAVIFSGQIIDDRKGRFGGGAAIYVPANVVVGSGAEAISKSYATLVDPAVPGYVRVAVPTSNVRHTIYLDTSDDAQPYKVATNPVAMPVAANTWHVVTVFGGYQGIASGNKIVSTAARVGIATRFGVAFDAYTGRLSVSAINGWVDNALWSLAPIEGQFREIDLSAYLPISPSVAHVWIDVSDVLANGSTSPTAIKVTDGYSTANPPPPTSEGRTILLGSIFGGRWISAQPGHDIPIIASEFGCGREDNDHAPLLFGASAPVDLTIPESLALGFTRGWTEVSDVFYGGYFTTPAAGKFVHVRFFVETDTENYFGSNRQVYGYRREADGSTVRVNIGTLYRSHLHSTKCAEYIGQLRLPEGVFVGLYVGARTTNAGEVRVFGLQFGVSEHAVAMFSATDYPRKSDTLADRIRALEIGSSADPFDPIMPARLCLHEDRPLPLFIGQAFPIASRGRYRATLVSTPSDRGAPIAIESVGGSIEIPAARLSPTAEIWVADTLGSPEILRKFGLATRRIEASEITGQTIRLHMIGDSITDETGAGVQTIERLKHMGFVVEAIGTRDMQSDAPEDFGLAYKGEARSSRRTDDYTYARTADMVPVAVGNEAHYLAQPEGYSWTRNTYIRAATSGDMEDPWLSTCIRNGFLFDFRFYLDRFGLPDPHVITICLHTNNVRFQTAADAVAQVTDDHRIMIGQIRRACPDAAILIVVACAGRQDADAYWQASHWPMIKGLVAFARGLANPLVQVVPAWLAVDRDAGYKYSTTTDFYGRSIATLIDGIHPSPIGIRQMGEITAQAVAGAFLDL